jgi:hypothetical protein
LIGRCYGIEISVGNTRVTTISRQPSPVQLTINEKHPENVDYLNYLGSTVTNDASCTYEIKSFISSVKAAFKKKRALFARNLCVNLRKKLVICYIWNIWKII